MYYRYEEQDKNKPPISHYNEEVKEDLLLNNANSGVGGNDKYLISKLKTYNITVEKIDEYILKLNNQTMELDQSATARVVAHEQDQL
jgi:hypothetical protein